MRSFASGKLKHRSFYSQTGSDKAILVQNSPEKRMVMTLDRRQFARILVNSDVQVNISSVPYHSELKDLSLRGALVKTPESSNAQIGDTVSMSIRLQALNIPVTLHGRIVHLNDGCMGVLSELMDIDSMMELRRLIELNLGNEELLQREIHHLSSEEEQTD